MGPQTEVAQVPDLVAPSEVAIPADTPSGPEPAATERRGWRARTSRTLRPVRLALPLPRGQRSSGSSCGCGSATSGSTPATRRSGAAKSRPSGSAAAPGSRASPRPGVAGSASGKGGASYGWWAGFLHNFVIPNASWIGRFISLGEILIGVALILGLFTGVAAFAGLSLNIIYMFTGSAGVNPMYAILSVLLVLAWRNAGWIRPRPIHLQRRLDDPPPACRLSVECAHSRAR